MYTVRVLSMIQSQVGILLFTLDRKSHESDSAPCVFSKHTTAIVSSTTNYQS